jgi:hypothetical protein
MNILLSGEPYWKANTSTWKRVKTFYWPAKESNQCDRSYQVTAIVSHSDEVKSGTSKMRIVQGDETLAEIEWANGLQGKGHKRPFQTPTPCGGVCDEKELGAFMAKGQAYPFPFLEIQLSTTCQDVIGQVHSIYIESIDEESPHKQLYHSHNHKPLHYTDSHTHHNNQNSINSKCRVSTSLSLGRAPAPKIN